MVHGVAGRALDRAQAVGRHGTPAWVSGDGEHAGWGRRRVKPMHTATEQQGARIQKKIFVDADIAKQQAAYAGSRLSQLLGTEFASLTLTSKRCRFQADRNTRRKPT
jgi:hypothetical protein